MRCYVPPGREDQEICKRGGRIAGAGCEDAEDGGVDVVDGDGAHVDKFGQVVLVRNLHEELTGEWIDGARFMGATYIVTVPCHNIERRMVLCALEELAPKLVNDFPRLLLNLVFSNRMQEVPRVCQPIGAEGAEFRKLEVGSPDFCT